MSDERTPDEKPGEYIDLPPILPTGSGVADLEIAYEQMILAENAALRDGPVLNEGVSGAPTTDAMPTESGDDALDSAAHPS
ncbi:hypothetical protein ACFSGX_10625 [Sphingomonas arantia]|uniref:Uncharacterized protein n=1 Tax=Sphingomonas arantia TaxID=1460676 RepID=A0ABW4U123_9SPHN